MRSEQRVLRQAQPFDRAQDADERETGGRGERDDARVLGTIDGIFIAAAGGAPMQAVHEVRAVAGRGLDGDRYFARAGTYSGTPGTGRDLTLVDVAELEALERTYDLRLPPGASRRNLQTRGVDLMGLIGRRFWLGEALCEGMRECPPCAHLERLTRKGVAKAMAGRGGLRAEVRQDGAVQVGDTIRLAV